MPTTPTPPPSKKQRTDTSFFGDLFTSSAVAQHDEVNSYMMSADTSDDVLAYWKVKASSWPRLAAVARAILAIPATDTSSVRVFSLAD
jgi:hypothetical protein